MRLIVALPIVGIVGFATHAPATTLTSYIYELQTIKPASCTPTQGVSCTDLTNYPYIQVDGYYNQFDGGGGYFVQNNFAGCNSAANGGTIILDGLSPTPNCFSRATPPTDARQWGAKCDVVVSPKGGTWIPTRTASYMGVSYTGAISINTPSTNPPQPGQFLAVTQLGSETQDTGGTKTPAIVWADRWSTLANIGTGYKVGDLLSFKGATMSGTFAQQVAILVDQVNSTGGITKWRFLSGGQYSQTLANSLPDNDMTVDTTHSSYHGTGATLTAEWSGWSVSDVNYTPTNYGASLSSGSIVTFDLTSGGTVNQGHYPKLLVTNVDSMTGAATSWQWLDYGSYFAISGNDLMQTSPTCTAGVTCMQLTPEWTHGTLATRIGAVTTCGGHTCIFPMDSPTTANGAPSQTNGFNVESLYYGDDDGLAIQHALNFMPNAQPLTISGNCGTAETIDLPDNSDPTEPNNVALVGDVYKSSGLFAFATDIADRTSIPLMNHLIYGGISLAFGGGMRDLQIEGMGIPQGLGYYGSATLPAGYCTGCASPPCYNTPSVCIPSSGSIVEIDGAKESIFSNLAIYDAYGEGNAEFQGGFADADPTNAAGSGNDDFGSVFMDTDRFAVRYNQYGALDPSYAVYLPSSHDSQFSHFDAFDGTEADIYETKASIWGGLHVESDILNNATGTKQYSIIPWTGIGPLAGLSLYGLETSRNVVLSNMQCDMVWDSCVFAGDNPTTATADVPTAITNVVQKCGLFANVWSGYFGVELASGTAATSVSNVAGSQACSIPSSQLVHLDGPTDPSVLTSFQDPTAQFCLPSIGYRSGRYYTTPVTSSGSIAITSNRLYAIPVQIACGVTVTALSTWVMTAGSSGSSCEYGIYAGNGSGLPGALLLDAGHVATTTTGADASITGLAQTLSPGLVFLVVDCNTVTTMPTLKAGSALASLVGLASPGDTTAYVKANQTYGALPANFPSFGYIANAVAPLLFFSP